MSNELINLKSELEKENDLNELYQRFYLIINKIMMKLESIDKKIMIEK